MKIKNVICPVVLSLSLISHALPHSNQEQIAPADLQKIVDFEDQLGTQTPLQFSTQNIKDFFQAKSLPLNSLKGREQNTEHESKTAIFNTSLMGYIKKVYNSKNYANSLSQDGSHFIQFFSLSQELNLSTDAVYQVVRLLYNKIKSCELVDDTVVIQIVAQLPESLERHFYQKTEQSLDLSLLKKTIEHSMLAKFTDTLPEFHSQPDVFIGNLAEEIATIFKNEAEALEKEYKRKESQERLRQVIIRLLESMISKSIWNAKAPEGIWQSFISIANNLQLVGAHNIIDHMDDLDDLLWALVHRFCFFLDLMGSTLPVAFYEEIESDITNKVVFFLEAKEQDEGITPKKELLADYLLQAKAKAIAFERRGIITQPMI